MSDVGYGYLGPQDVTSDYNHLLFVIGQVLSRVRTVCIVKVVAAPYGGSGVAPVGFLDAQVIVNMLDGVGNVQAHDTIEYLPYFRLQGGANAVICDPQVGDIGVALVCDRDTSSVRANRGQANPGSNRRFNLSDGIYLGGILNVTPTCYVGFVNGGITMSPDSGTTYMTITPGLIEMRAAAIRLNE